MRTWRPTGASRVITDPPYVTGDALDLYTALADFALDVLPDGAPLVVMTDIVRLPGVLRAMDRPPLVYRATLPGRSATESTAATSPACSSPPGNPCSSTTPGTGKTHSGSTRRSSHAGR